MEYKLSRFNYVTESKDGEMILYNSYYGTESICKVSSEQKDTVAKVLKQNSFENIDPDVIEKLKKGGFLVDINCDEDQMLKFLYINKVNSGYLSLCILPTEQCNYRCQYCFESFKRGRMPESVQNGIIDYVEKNIRNYKGLNIDWFGGEPLVAMDIIEKMSERFIEICKKNRVPYVANVTSNGYLLTLNNFKKLYKYHVRDYTITIDGIRETHNEQKPLAGGGETFDRVIQNLLDIKENVKSNFFHVNIRTNFTMKIYEKMEEFVDFYYERFHGDRRFTFLARPAGDWGGDAVKEIKENLCTIENFDKVLEKMTEFPKQLDYGTQFQALNPGSSMCLFTDINTFLIDSEGTIRKCSCLLDLDENRIGKVADDGSVQIDFSEKAKWVNFCDADEKCRECFFAPACLGNACPATTSLFHKPDEECTVYEKVHIDKVLQLYVKFHEVEVLV